MVVCFQSRPLSSVSCSWEQTHALSCCLSINPNDDVRHTGIIVLSINPDGDLRHTCINVLFIYQSK